MDAYVKQVLSFTITPAGLLNYSNQYGENSMDVQRGIDRVVAGVLTGIQGFRYIELGYTNEMVDMLYFHVYSAEFIEGSQWQ